MVHDDDSLPDDIEFLVVGAGIVGSAVARELAPRHRVLVVDAGPPTLTGSTGHAPGFIGEFGGAAVATELATLTTRAFARIARGDRTVFERTGCLEVATTEAGAAVLAGRARDALAQGLRAVPVSPADAAAMAPETVPATGVVAALHFPDDATADAGAVTAALRAHAEGDGAVFAWHTRIRSVHARPAERVRIATADGRMFTAEHVVLCTGIWADACLRPSSGGPSPIVPVRHPYVYGPVVGGETVTRPFVRFPEHHVYARRHGRRWGFGTYDHAPVPADATTLASALRRWDGRFDDAVARGLERLADPARFTPTERVDGVFAVTPDNLPLVGPVRDGIWMAAAVWVTHSVGAAQVLAALVEGRPAPVGDPAALSPRRFDAWDPGIARRAALRHYNDIYERG